MIASTCIMRVTNPLMVVTTSLKMGNNLSKDRANVSHGVCSVCYDYGKPYENLFSVFFMTSMYLSEPIIS